MSLGQILEKIQFAKPGQWSVSISPETEIGKLRCGALW